MIAMGVRHNDVGNALAAHGIENGLDMRLIVGTGIENDDVALTDDVSDGSGERERSGVWRNDAADQRRRLLAFAGRERKYFVEGDVIEWNVVAHRLSMTQVISRVYVSLS